MRRAFLIPALILVAFLEGCKTGTPSKAESDVINQWKHSISVGNKNARNPISFSAATFSDGKEAFSHYCVACHGMDGQNTGVPFADRMTPPVPSLASKEVQAYTDGQLKWVIDNGVAPSGMPASKGILSDDEQWSIVVFLRHLPPAGSLGEPSMYQQ